MKSAEQSDIAHLIIETLNLEDVSAEDIDPNEPLFGDGLGLDSIDALELSLAISKTYGVQLKADDPESRAGFASLASLTKFIEDKQQA